MLTATGRTMLWGMRVSAGTVSDLNQKMYERIDKWRNRPIEGEYPYVYLDGISLKMKEKRMHKLAIVQESAEAPELYGSSKYKTLFVAWGSVYQALKEALDLCDRDDIAMLHFSQVYPVHAKAREYLDRAEKVVAVENNQTGQFCSLLRDETDFNIKEKILKYNGYPFTSDELAEKISEVL